MSRRESRPQPSSSALALPERELEQLMGGAMAYVAACRAPRTLAEYAGQWRRFERWARERGRASLPCAPDTLALYLSQLAQRLKVASISMALSAIAHRHTTAGLEAPTRHPAVLQLWSGIRRSLGTAQRRVAPLVTDELRAISRILPRTLQGKRDRALLAIGLAGALRRSELVALELGDVRFVTGGIELEVRRSKTDQEARGVRIGIARGADPLTCPVRALQAWLQAARLRRGRIFRRVLRDGRVGESLSGASVALIVKRSTRRAAIAGDYSGHSLRAGLATSAARAGKTDRRIMEQGRWAGRSMVDRYVREARLLDTGNASADIGL
jgi:integrase